VVDLDLTKSEQEVIEQVRKVVDSGYGSVEIEIRDNKIKDIIPKPRIRINQ